MGSPTPIRQTVDRLRRAAATTDAVEHARLFSRAILTLMTRPGTITAAERAELDAAGRAATTRAMRFRELEIPITRLESGSRAAGTAALLWGLSPGAAEQHCSALDRADLFDRLAIFEADLRAGVHHASLARRAAGAAAVANARADTTTLVHRCSGVLH